MYDITINQKIKLSSYPSRDTDSGFWVSAPSFDVIVRTNTIKHTKIMEAESRWMNDLIWMFYLCWKLKGKFSSGTEF